MIILNSSSIPCPDLALVSTNEIELSSANFFPSSLEITLCEVKSILFPHKIKKVPSTTLSLASASHLFKELKLDLSVTS